MSSLCRSAKEQGGKAGVRGFLSESLFVFLLVLPLTSLLCPGNKLICSIGAIRKHDDVQECQLQREHGKQGFAATNRQIWSACKARQI